MTVFHGKMNIQQAYCWVSLACVFSLWVTDVDSMIYDGRSSPALFSGQTGIELHDRTAGFPPRLHGLPSTQSHESSQTFEGREIQACETVSVSIYESVTTSLFRWRNGMSHFSELCESIHMRLMVNVQTPEGLCRGFHDFWIQLQLVAETLTDVWKNRTIHYWVNRVWLTRDT